MDTRIPVTLVTGFLGSGKTSLLSALLRRPELGPFAVVINEFGEVALDQALIGRVEGQLVVLSGGCLCCGIGGDLATTLLDLHARRAALPFERVVVETSGLADPGPLLAPLVQAPELTGLFRVDGVVAVVDALQGLRELERHKVSVKQVALADRIILSKSDIAASLAVARLKQRIAEINPWAPLRAANHGAVESAWLFDPAPAPTIPYSDLRNGNGGHDHDHAHGIGAFCLWLDKPFTWDLFVNAVTRLTEAHGEAILRMKGVLNIEGHPTAVHGVQHFLHPPEPLATWPDEERRSRVVVIAERLTETQVRRFFPVSTH
ncbi:GTP-binding protein [Rhodoblastus acidophilus]|uniref:GTP-binding protein n=1 Tax=Rhodoblastus acidophilus TaxID=1074 RepID=A0A6N8DT95_RHOAC|nr:GTP-binding protein [Rhodoblastus acidophilus]MCW2275808.1 G3E family GTPase [Rhodoblastus acidophilus]MTV32413.1 GTP-binding protein [Rhodoblastus acidophilus]